MTKLQKHKSYQYKNRDHFKHVVIIPDEIIDQLGWNSGDDLRFTITDSGLLIKDSTTVNLENEDDK